GLISGRSGTAAGTGREHMEGYRQPAGTAKNGVSAAFRPGYDVARDRRRHRPVGKRCESTSVSGAAGGAHADGGIGMNSHLSSEEMYQWLSGEHAADVEEHFRECP